MWKKWNICPHKYTNRSTHKQIMIYTCNIENENETGIETDNDNDNR